MNTNLKRSNYAALVRERKECHACKGLSNPSDRELAGFDSNEIGPWTQLQADLDADVMVVGQDWGDVRYYLVNRGLDDLRNPTTRALERLLKSIGMTVSLASYGQGPRKLFLTNAVRCLKNGGLQGRVEPTWFKNCGSRFLKRQIDVVAPRIVVTLGEKAYRAICAAFELRPQKFRSAVGDPTGTLLPSGSRLFAVYHCGMRILNTHRPLEAQLRDWQRIGKALNLG